MLTTQVILRLIVALVLGAAIGIERQWRQRMAGVRTNALVAVGAAMFVSLTTLANDQGSPTRIAAQVVSGIGFLGAGVIIRDGLNIRGLNTAATLWCAAGVGVLAGSGFYDVAIIGSLLVLSANLGLRSLGRRLQPVEPGVHPTTVHYTVRAVCRADAENRVRSHLLNEALSQGLRLQSIQSEDADGGLRIEVQAELLSGGLNDSAVEHIVAHISLDQSVSAVKWEVTAQPEDEPLTLLEQMADSGRGRSL